MSNINKSSDYHTGTGDFVMHQGGADAEKHDKTTLTFERKKEQDKDMDWNKEKDLNKDKDWNKEKDLYKDKDKEINLKKDDKDIKLQYKDKDHKDDLVKEKNINLHKDDDKIQLNKEDKVHKESEGKGIINTIKEEVHKETEGKGIINAIKEKVKDVLGSGDNDKSKDKDRDEQMKSSADYNKNVGASAGISSDKQFSSTSGSSDIGQQQQYSSNLPSSGQYSNLGNSNKDKQFGGSVGVGMESHKDKAENISSYDKNVAVDDKNKDSAHKAELHGSLYTSGAGSSGSTFKTNEAK